ncbi:MAG: hypothetical protein Kow002_19130 [Anaerolineales bacterium]
MSFAEGENIGPYRIIEKLGQGGMATVYKAYHAKLDRYVAIKVLHPAFGEDQSFEARFQREARVVARLDHPNIVPVYDYAEHEHRPYLVMKFIEGVTLKARLEDGKLSGEEIVKVIDSVGAALAYAHEQGILHRDVKPSNVLLASDGQIYLADFGLARIAQAGESTLSSDSIMGTPQYISPEQARGDKDLDSGTDIYSLGVLLYELVAGQVPFSADTPFSIIHDHIYTPLPMPRAVNPDVPEAVERVLLKALAKDRTDRFENVSEMVQAFKSAWAQTEPAADSKTGRTLPSVTQDHEIRQAKATITASQSEKSDAGMTKKPKKKRPVWMYVAASILSVLCCLVILFALREGRDERAEEPPLEPLPATEFVEPQPPAGRLEVKEAEQRAAENPDDPFAQLELAITYWDAGMEKPAYETLNQVAEREKDNVPFLIQAGDEFHIRQAWLASAAMYLRVLRQVQGDEVPAHIFVNFNESVYQAATRPEFVQSSPLRNEVMRVNETIGLVAQARHAFHAGRPEDGWQLLDKVYSREPDFPEALLLEGEVALMEKRYQEARDVLSYLLSLPNVPEWVVVMAEDYLNQIP